MRAVDGGGAVDAAATPGLPRRFARLAALNTLSNLTVPVAGLADTVMLGRLDDVRFLAGVVLAALIFDYLYFGCAFLRMGTTGLTAQAWGRGEIQEVAAHLYRALLLAAVLGLLTIALRGPLGDAGFRLLAGTAEVEEAGRRYYDARIWGAPAAFANLALVGWFLGRAEAARALLLVAVAYVGNVVLNWWFIIELGWAAFGAGVATAASQWLAACLGLALALTTGGAVPAWRTVLDRAALRRIVALSGHLVIRTLLLITAFAVFTNMSALFGTARLAANGLILRVLSLASYLVDGAAFAGETLAGMAFGAGDRQELRRVLLLTMAAAIVCAVAFLVPVLMFPTTVYGLLVDHEDVATLAAGSNFWLLPVLLFAALAYAFDGFFLGLTQGRLLSRAMVLSLGIGFAPIAWAAAHFRDERLLWLSMVGLMAARAITLGLAARRYLTPGGAVPNAPPDVATK